MNRPHRFFARARGSMIQECVMAIVITALVLTSVVRTLSLVARQRHLAEQRIVARYVAANLMEDAQSCAWSQLTTEDRNLSAESSGMLDPRSGARAVIKVDEEADGVRRIQIAVESPHAASRSPLARLVAWRYRSEEPAR